MITFPSSSIDFRPALLTELESYSQWNLLVSCVTKFSQLCSLATYYVHGQSYLHSIEWQWSLVCQFPIITSIIGYYCIVVDIIHVLLSRIHFRRCTISFAFYFCVINFKLIWYWKYLYKRHRQHEKRQIRMWNWVKGHNASGTK